MRLNRLLQKNSLTSLLALPAGALITLSQAPFDFWPLSLLAPLLLLLLLQDTTPGQAALRGWLFGLGVFGSGASWVYVSIHEHGQASALLASALTLGFVAGLALFFALHAWIWQRGFSKVNPLLGWPALWILMEGFRSWFLTGFPWLLLGTAHLESPFSGWVPILGVYGVSGLAVVTGLLVYRATQPQQTPRSRLLWLAPAALLLVSGWLLQQKEWTHPVGEPLQLGMVQGNVAQEDKWDPAKLRQIIQRYLSLTYQLGDQPDLLLWPETALPLLPDQAGVFLEGALLRAKEGAGLISGLPMLADAPGRYHNGLLATGTAQGEYHKVKLVPFGEYVPLEKQLRGLIAFFDLPMSSFDSGQQYPALLEYGGTRIAPMICYEVAYAGFTARQASNSHWLLTVSNDSWFGTSIGPLQHFQIARMRALETGRSLARVTNNGITALVDHRGRVVERLPQFEAGVLLASIQPREGSTPFMWTGTGPLFLLCALLLAGLCFVYSDRRRKTRPSQR